MAKPLASSRHGPTRELPPGFPVLEGDSLLVALDSLIVSLLIARSLYGAPPTTTARAQAATFIERTMAASYGFELGTGTGGKRARRSLLWRALASANAKELPAAVDRVAWAEMMIRQFMPLVKLDRQVLRDAVERWPNARQRVRGAGIRDEDARQAALHALAKALDCDSKSLSVQIRQDRLKKSSA